MKPSRAELRKALDALERVERVCVVLATIVGDGQETFESDERVQWAAQMGLIRVGEAVATGNTRHAVGTGLTPVTGVGR